MTRLHDPAPQAGAPSDRSWLDRYFHITRRGSSIGQELRGGLTTFMAMAYIIVLNPIILSGATDINGDHLSVAQLTTMTVLSAAVVTIVMGVAGRAPIALAAALGISPVVAFQAAPLMTWPEAMGLVVWQGVVVILLVVTGLRSMIMAAIPTSLNLAIGVGIGAFVALLGLNNAGFISNTGSTLLQLGTSGQLTGWPVVIFLIGLAVAAVLLVRGFPGAILIGIATATAAAVAVNYAFGVSDKAWGATVPELPGRLLDTPDFGLFLNVDLFGAWTSAGFVSAGVIVFTLVLAGFFDALGTILAIGEKAKITDERGRMPYVNNILLVDGAGAISGGLTSSSATLVFVESTAGVGEGARTGLASVVTGSLFAVALFLNPVTGMVPTQAAACALVLVGAMMMMQVARIDWSDLTVAIPAFLTIVLMPFTYSIANGIGAGVIAYAVLKTASGRARDVGWLMWGLSAVFAVYFAMAPIEGLLGVG